MKKVYNVYDIRSGRAEFVMTVGMELEAKVVCRKQNKNGERNYAYLELEKPEEQSDAQPKITNPDAFRFFLRVVETMRAHAKQAAGAKNDKHVKRCDEALTEYLNTTLERMRVLGFDEVPENIV